jgi:NAD(P)-dependent dehydrogenase (short-subunit alcohol dehydrogenase family)
MKHSIALVTGTTSGLGYAAASMLATKGYSHVIVTGRSLVGVQETAAQLTAETKNQVFIPLELDLNEPTSVQSALTMLFKLGLPIDFLLLNAGLVPGKKRVLTAAGVEASEAPLIGHHQLTVGLLHTNLLSPNVRIVITSAEPARGGVPMFKYTEVPAFAAKYFRGDRTAAAEALIRNGPHVKYAPNNAYADAKLIVAWWAAALARRLPSGMAVYAVSPGASNATNVARNAVVEVSDDSNRESHSRHESDAGDRSPSVPPGVGARNRSIRAILRFGSREVLRPNGGAAPTTPPRSRQPGSRVAGRRQCLRHRLVTRIIESGVLKERRSR